MLHSPRNTPASSSKTFCCDGKGQKFGRCRHELVWWRPDIAVLRDGLQFFRPTRRDKPVRTPRTPQQQIRDTHSGKTDGASCIAFMCQDERLPEGKTAGSGAQNDASGPAGKNATCFSASQRLHQATRCCSSTKVDPGHSRLDTSGGARQSLVYATTIIDYTTLLRTPILATSANISAKWNLRPTSS